MLSKILLISIFSFLFVFSSNLLAQNANSKTYDEKNLLTLEEKSFSIQSGKELNIEASLGDVNITTWDKSEVYVEILGNEKAKEKISFHFNNDNNKVELIAKKEGSFLNWNWFSKGIKLKFYVKVPTSFNTKINTSGGDISISNVEGDNNLKTSGGDVSAKETKGNLNISTSGGDISLKKANGEMNISTSGGDINGSDFIGSLSASTSGGDIYLKGNNSKINASTSGGDIDVEYYGDNKGIELYSSGGDISLKVPKDFNATAKMYTSGGNISCNLTANNANKISSTKFEADLNNGGNLVKIKTSGGDINVMGK